MGDSNRGHSRIADNRMAAAIVAGSLLVAVALAAVVLFRAGIVAFLVPERGPAIDAMPLYLLLVVFLIGLVLWSWGRVLSWFE